MVRVNLGILLTVKEKCCVLSELRDCCLFLFKKLKYTFSARYNIIVIERSWSRGGESERKLHISSTCTSVGPGNNAEHSQGKSGNLLIEIEWEWEP